MARENLTSIKPTVHFEDSSLRMTPICSAYGWTHVADTKHGKRSLRRLLSKRRAGALARTMTDGEVHAHGTWKA